MGDVLCVVILMLVLIIAPEGDKAGAGLVAGFLLALAAAALKHPDRGP